MIDVICKKCGKSFQVYPAVLKRGSGKYCSRKCSDNGEKHEVKCAICGTPFTTYQHRINDGRGKYCSRSCLYKFRTTQPAWNKGKPAPWSIGNKFRLGSKNKFLSDLSKTQTKDKNYKWKGDDVGYRALHYWVERQLGKPTVCESCGRTKAQGARLHWANKSHKYLRDKNDWLRLCAKCHGDYDKRNR